MQQQRFLMPGFWRSVAAVLSGTAIAQALPILGSLIIARQYLPAEFGSYAAWLGVVAIAAVIATGRFETSFAIVPDGEPRRHAVVCTLITLCLSSSLFAVICAILLATNPVWISGVDPFLVVLFTPAALLVAGAQVWQTWAATEGRYRALSIMRICQAVSIVILQIVAGAFMPSATTLALTYVLGLLIGLCVSFRLLPLGALPHRTADVLRQFWSRYVRFPAYSLPADGINTLAGQLPILVVASRFGPEVTGLLAMTMRTLGAPIALLGKSVLDVFKRQAAVSYRERGECRADYLQTFWVLAAGSVVASLVLLFSSDALFAFAFGEEWRISGTMAIWLLPMFAMAFIASPLSYMVYIVEKQQVDLVWQICLLAMTVITLNLPVGYPLVLQSYSWGYAALYVAYLMMSYRFSLGNAR